MTQTHTPGEGHRPHHRLRLLVTATALAVLAVLASLAPVGPTTAPAGAFGSKPIGCGATGSSGVAGSRAVASTTGSSCGSNWVRWRFYWGPGSWAPPVYDGPANIVENPHLYAGGGGHRACGTCNVVDT